MRFGVKMGAIAVASLLAVASSPLMAQTVLPLPGQTPQAPAAQTPAAQTSPATAPQGAAPAERAAPVPIVAPPVRPGFPGFKAPVDREQIRLRALDRCILGLWNHKSINRDRLSTQCQCAATRTARAATEADLAAMSASLTYAPTVEGAFREAIAACVRP
jgi:hypothetical protein